MNDNDTSAPEDMPVPEYAVWPRLTRSLAMLGGVLVLLSAVVVVVSVIVRGTGLGAIGGDFEIVQMATALSVFCFLPYCQARRGNIMVDTFTTWLPRSVQRGLDGLWDLVYAGMAGIIAWQLMRGAIDTVSSNTVSMVLGLPTGWAIAVASVLAAILCLVTLATAWRVFKVWS